MEKKLKKSVEDYNSTYNTSFSVLSTVSLGPTDYGSMPDDLNHHPNIGGMFLIFDQNKKVYAVYTTEDFHSGLKLRIKKDLSGKWIFRGLKVDDYPTSVTFIAVDQSKMYEKESFRSYLIHKLKARHDEYGILRTLEENNILN